MTKFEKWLFKGIVRKEVIQGNHDKKILEMYRIIREACEREFTEDNKPTLDFFLKELFDEANKPKPDEFDVLWKKMDLEKESPTCRMIAKECYRQGKLKGNK